MANFKKIGQWWNDRDIELVEIEGKIYALDGWNGEQYTNCWECIGFHNMDVGMENIEIIPVYSIKENDNGGYDIIDYNVL